MRLGVNIDHVATLRNARGGMHPDPIKAAIISEESGADLIVAHLREDRRHINEDDVANIIKNSGYSPAQAEGDLKTMSKTKSVRALGNKIDIVQLDSDGQPVETWTLINPWIKDVKYGELDYESDDITNIEVEVRYDWASCKTRNEPYVGVASAGGGGSSQVWTDGSGGDDRGTSGGVSDLRTTETS